MKTLLEGWRKLVNERDMPTDFYKGKSFEEFKRDLAALGNIWIFFDTETTGLDPIKKQVQETQVAATAYDFGPWYAGEGQPTPVPDGKINLKVRLTQDVLDVKAQQSDRMSIEDPEDPRHVEFAQGEMERKAKAMAFKRLRDEGHITGKTRAQQSKSTDEFFKSGGGRLFAQYRDEAMQSLSPSDIPLYRDKFTDDPEEMGYGPGKKSGTVTALLRLGRYGDKTTSFELGEDVYRKFTEYLDRMEEFGDGIVLTAQNAPFDVKQMNAAYEEFGIPVPDIAVFDTAKAFSNFLKPKLQNLMSSGEEIPEKEQKIISALTAVNKRGMEYISVSLGKIINAFVIENMGLHDALADVEMTMMAFKEIMDYLDESGAPSGGTSPKDDAQYMKDRYNVDVQPMDTLDTSNKKTIDKLQEEWEYALTRKQRELIEREIALLKKL